MRVDRLQCGHGDWPWRTQSALIRHGDRTAGFNAATAIGRGEPATDLSAIAGRMRLQCGHGDVAVENCPSIAVTAATLSASMRPRRFAVENRADCTPAAAPRASMRPRRFAVENRAALRQRQPHRRFNAATAMSRGERMATARVDDGHASMRPRRFAVENREPLGMTGRTIVASMRPRRLRRGERDMACACSTADALQCGHGDSPWRTMLTRTSGPATAWLQCGHGDSPWRTPLTLSCTVVWCFNAATAICRGERLTRAALRRAGGSFNAATANSPWRTAPARSRDARRSGASMRPRRISRGERATRDAGAATTTASMRPRRFAVENQRAAWHAATASMRPRRFAVENRACRGDHRHRTRRFNAATANSPWRTRLADSRRPRAWSRASMRPRRLAVENRRAAGARQRAVRLQCGHGDSPWRTWPNVLALGHMSRGFNAATAIRPWRTCRT